MIVWTWLTEHFYECLILAVLAWYHRTLIMVPIRGGNGVVQMAELAQAIILTVFIFSVKAEIEREHEWSVFESAYWYALLGTVIMIAGFKGVGKSLIDKIGGGKADAAH